MAKPSETHDSLQPMIEDKPSGGEAEDAGEIGSQSPEPNLKNACVQFQRARSIPEIKEAAVESCAAICKGASILVVLCLAGVFCVYLIIVGSLNLNNCPVNHRIPIFIIVSGVFGLIRVLVSCYYRLRYKGLKTVSWAGVYTLLILGWLAPGAAWTFSKEPTFDDPRSATYCDKLTFYSSVAFIAACITPIIILLILAVIAGCCFIGTLCQQYLTRRRNGDCDGKREHFRTETV